jgi:hypothetical protein
VRADGDAVPAGQPYGGTHDLRVTGVNTTRDVRRRDRRHQDGILPKARTGRKLANVGV